jgi:hypothetical protein
MRTALTLVAASALLGLWLAFDRAIDIADGMPQVRMSMSSRIWLASGLMFIFAASNLFIAWLALAREGIRKWAAIVLLLFGTIGALYLPLWSLGLPGLSTLLSVRSHSLTLLLATGGLLSLLKLQLAWLAVVGLAALLRRNRPNVGEVPNAA